jgi:uncharacterized membrane protein
VEDYWPLIAFALIIVFFAPIVMSIVALAATSRLRLKLEALERRGASPRGAAAEPPPALATAVAAPPEAPPPTALPVTVAPTSSAAPLPSPLQRPSAPQPQPARAGAAAGMDIERVIGGKWLNWIGIAALLVGTAFFLKYAFDNNWIGPLGRVTIGLLAGTALIVYSQWLFKKTYVYFAEGVAGLGAGVLFLSLYAAWNFYHLIPNLAAFAGMVAITAVLLGLALARDSQRIAVLALIGGFITPLLVSTGADAQVQLFGYLALLNAGLLWVAHARNWRSLPLAFLFSLMYFWSWYGAYYDPSKLALTLGFATVFFVEFAMLPALRALKNGTQYPEQVVLALLNTAWFVLALHVMLFDHHRWLLTIDVVVLAIVYLGLARFAPAPSSGQPLARVLYAGLALTLVTLAMPIRLAGAWITIGWAIEGAVLIWSGFSTNTRLLRVAGLTIFMFVAIRLVVAPIEGGHLFLNPRFETFALVIACLGATAFVASRHREELASGERTLYSILQVAINVLALWALTSEVLGSAQMYQRQQLAVTIVWTLYAAALLILGVRANSGLLRWQGLVLLGIAIIKVFLFDLSELSLGLRILSFMALGIVLLGISFLYQRRAKPDHTEDKP